MKTTSQQRTALSKLVPLTVIAGLLGAFWLGWKVGRPTERTGPAAVVADEASTTLYTCSMHPQIRLPDPKAKCPICHMDLIPVVDDGASGNAVVTLGPAARELARVETSLVQRSFPRAEVRMVGRVAFNETRAATIAARFPGRLERLYVDYVGVPVRVGEHIGELYSPELLVAQAELRQAADAARRTDPDHDVLARATRSTLEAAREKLRLWGLTPEQIQDLEQRDDPMESLSILSPVSGVVVEKSAQQGEYLKTGQTIVSVADLDHLWIELAAYESQLPWLRYGERVTFETDSAPGVRFEGRVSFIAPTLDPRSRTTAVRVNYDNSDRRLKPGLFVRAVLRPRFDDSGRVLAEDLAGKWISPMHPEVIKDGPGSCDVCGMDLVPAEELGYISDESLVEAPLVIPASAALLTGKRAVVYVVDASNEDAFEAREVRLGARAGDLYVVQSGLSEGERIVTRGAFTVDSAAQILAKPSMMSMASEVSSETTERDVPAGFLRSISAVYDAYFAAGAALANDDITGFRSALPAMQTALQRVESMDLSGDGAKRWTRLAKAFDLPDESAAIDLARARQSYHRWSDAAIELAREFGQSSAASVQLVHCPMAFDFSGADWLQPGEVVSNPYFGDEMLRCGTIQQRFASVDSAAAGTQGDQR